jgi:AraC-like DNA-binding protein
MAHDTDIIASGNLASSRRIIAGLLGQLAFLDIGRNSAEALLLSAGLPARALDEPDFPVSLQQELEICAAMAAQVPRGTSLVRLLFASLDKMGIENLGVIGMAMRHAPTAIDSLRVCLAYPELTMGHCRMVVRRQPDGVLLSFHMERPTIREADEAAIDDLVTYLEVLDLTSSLRNIQDFMGSRQPPLRVRLPYPEPVDWQAIADKLDFQVTFSAEETSLCFPAAVDTTPLPAANPILFQMYSSLAEKMSRMLAEDISFEERVVRWLWASSPPPTRADVAGLLALSERSLNRHLAREGTTYAELLARVQAERAQNLLRNGELSVSEIGYRLGYSEPAAFSRAFTHWVGQSPSKWRKAHTQV